MNAGLHEHLDACRRRGLVVDEDFERGISRRVRAFCTTAVGLFIVVLGITAFLAIAPKTDGLLPRLIHMTARPQRNRLVRPESGRTRERGSAVLRKRDV
jgi:hypothetical protein